MPLSMLKKITEATMKVMSDAQDQIIKISEEVNNPTEINANIFQQELE